MNTIVHTTQQVYRQLVNATSRPGHVELITEEVKNYTEDYSTYNYNKLYTSLIGLKTKRVPFISYNDLIESGRKDISIMLNVKRHFTLLLQAKYLKKRGYLRNNDLIERKKAIFDKNGEEFKGYLNIWNEPNFRINQLVKAADDITLREIVWVLNKIDGNLKSIGNMKDGKLEGYERQEDVYKTFLEIIDRRA